MSAHDLNIVPVEWRVPPFTWEPSRRPLLCVHGVEGWEGLLWGKPEEHGRQLLLRRSDHKLAAHVGNVFGARKKELNAKLVFPGFALITRRILWVASL